MEEELDLSAPVERDITSESGAANGAEVSVGLDPSSQAASAAPEEASADHESTTAWDNPDVVSRQNLNSNNDALTSNAQQMWQESYGIKGGDEETSQPISEKAKAEKQAAEDDKRADFMERQERESEDRAERRREWMERTHRIGDMEMSGADLEKLISFMKNPAMKEKIAERLAKKGMDKDEIKKAQKDSQEWASLKEKESKGEKLSAEEKARAEQLEQQKNVQVYVKASAEVKNEWGQTLSQNNEKNHAVALKQEDETKRYAARDNITEKLESAVSVSGDGQEVFKARGFGVAASGREASDKLSNVASLSEEFAKYSADRQISGNEMAVKKELPVTLAAATPRVAPSDSFSASL